GFIDNDGNLWVTGRVKEQYKLENGKYVVPSVLESKICASSIIENAIVLGAGKPYNVALIQPSSDFLESFKAEHHLINAAPETLQNNPKLRDLIATELKNTCERFRGYERPQKFAIILNEPSIANGLLTPTLKLKRREVEKQYHSLIASLYTHAN
ncbi:MAG: long-chain fatty acid--CoA ligase, partial [Proteobacteria bacterium]|nr:long-chain fatty acid--CoA ligase [Pseudomonadota bacterium]